MPLDTLEPGLIYEDQLFVSETLTVPGLATRAYPAHFNAFTDMPPVFASAMLIAFIEHTCIKALQPCLLSTEQTVGTAFNLTHRAPTPVGMAVFARVKLLKREERHLLFEVSCRDAENIICAGTHERCLIDAEKFMQRLASKALKAVA